MHSEVVNSCAEPNGNLALETEFCKEPKLGFIDTCYLYCALQNSPILFRPFSALCLIACVCTQLCSILFNPMDYSPPVSSVHGILQVSILEWVAISSSRESFFFFFLQGIFLSQRSNPHHFRLLHWQAGSLPLAPPGKPLVFNRGTVNSLLVGEVVGHRTELEMHVWGLSLTEKYGNGKMCFFLILFLHSVSLTVNMCLSLWLQPATHMR